MGNGNQSLTGKFKPEEWNQIISYENFKKMKHLKTGSEVGTYQLSFRDEDLKQTELKKFKSRLNLNKMGVVELVDVFSSGNSCSCGEGSLAVFENLNCKLSQHFYIILNQSLIILQQALYGYHALANHSAQEFEVNDKMIFLNSNNEVRVWFHPNLTSNSPQLPIIEGNQSSRINRMIESIFNTVQQHCQSPFPSDLLQRKQSMKPLDFSRAIDLVSEYSNIYENKTIKSQFNPSNFKSTPVTARDVTNQTLRTSLAQNPSPTFFQNIQPIKSVESRPLQSRPLVQNRTIMPLRLPGRQERYQDSGQWRVSQFIPAPINYR